ncbi:MAG: BamA/TamA family outer membrane protein [Planctomycetaceae bacterium]|nr:BamA/TamA family outer membrane protein [Planctomycetaceae bacterium]
MIPPPPYRQLLTILCLLAWPMALMAQEAALENIPLTDAPKYSISDIILKSLREGRVINTQPEAVRRSDVLKVLRVRLGEAPFAGDIETDASNLVNHYHYFKSVSAELHKDGAKTARLTFICEDPPVASLNFLELIDGRWQMNPEGSFEARTALGIAPGDLFSIERLDRELRERLFDSERFIDIKSEHRYAAEGVHVTVKMVREQMVDLVVLSGVSAETTSDVIASSQELVDYLGEDIGETTRVSDPKRRLGSKGNILFTSKFAGRHTIEMIRRSVRRHYVQKGYPDVDMTWHMVDVPVKPDGDKKWNLSDAARANHPELNSDQVDAVLETAIPGQKVLLLTVHEGPHVEIADIHFDGIESLLRAPGMPALEPGSLPSSYWPLWYAMPWTTREDSIKRALFQVMQNGPSVFDAHPDFNIDAASQDAAFIERHLRSAGWQDVKVLLKAIRYNNDRSRVELTYDLKTGPLYVVTHVGVRLKSQPPPGSPDGTAPEPLVASVEEIWEKLDMDGVESETPLEMGDGPASKTWLAVPPAPYNENLISGNPFDPGDQGAQQRIEALFGKHGYSRIRFEATPIYQDAGASIDGLTPELASLPEGVLAVRLAIDIDQGHKYRIGEIDIAGNLETKTSVILRQLALTPGELFNVDEMRRAENRLRRLQWFEQTAPGAGVQVVPNYTDAISPDDNDAYIVNITVHLVEGSTKSINFTAGYSPGASAFVSLSLAFRNFDLFDFPGFTGAGQTLELAIEPRVAERQRYSLSFQEPFMFGYPVSGSFSLSLTDQDRGPFTVGERGGRVSFGYRLMRDLSAFLSYENFINEISDVSASAPFELRREEGETHFTAISVEGIYSTIDHPFFPTDGHRLTFEYQLASELFGGEVNMWRMTAGAKQAFLLHQIDDTRDVTLSLSWVGIWQDIYGDTDRVPLSRRLFLGSIDPGRPTTNMRGFRRSGVGPSAGDDAIGGNFLMNSTAEVTLPVQPGFFWLVGFVDVGELVPVIDNFDPSGITASFGMGFRMQVPLFPAPLGVDFGWPLFDQPGNRRQVVAVNFAFGFG